MKPKLDVAKIKELALQKGERVGLVIAVAISVLILGYGVVTGLSSGGGNYQGTISDKNSRLKDKWQKEPPPQVSSEDVPGAVVKNIAWEPVPPSPKEASPWVVLADGVDSKRRNPMVMPIRTRETEIQMDYIRAPLLMYENSPNIQKVTVLVPKGAAGTVDAGRLKESLQPRRMVVVSAVFPYKEQLELIRHALRLYTIEEAMTPEFAPVFLGLNVMRSEVVPGGKLKWEPVYTFDGKKDINKEVFFKVSDSLTPVLRDGVYDDLNIQLHSSFITRGLCTPLPKLAFSQHPTIYPPLKLNGIETPAVDATATPMTPGSGEGGKLGSGMPGSGMPGGGMPVAGGADSDQKQVPWSTLPNQELAYRLRGMYYVFDPLGSLGAKDLKSGSGPGAGPGEGGMPKTGGSAPPGPKGGEGGFTPGPGTGSGMPTGMTTEINNLLARFVDVDVEPGKTYRYSVMVVMANPNYQKKDAVAFVSLAAEKALFSPWAFTPDITIPGDFYYYAYHSDGKLEAPVVSNGSEETAAKPDPHLGGRPAILMSVGQAPLQIHRWIGVEGPREIGAFAVAERVLTHRGQPIGRPGFHVEMPVWNPLLPGFFLDGISPNKKGKIVYASGKAPGIPINFQIPTGNPILVDFVEGNKYQRYVGKVGLADEAAQDILVMTPEGKLVVRNARDDSPREEREAETEDGKARLKQFNEWKDRVKTLRQSNMPTTQPGAPGTGS